MIDEIQAKRLGVRVCWHPKPEALGDGESEWRGKAQHVLSGEARYFRDWPALVAFLLETLPQLDGPEDPAEES